MKIPDSAKAEVFSGITNGLLFGGILFTLFLLWSSIKLNTPLYFLIDIFFIFVAIVIAVIIFILVLRRRIRIFKDSEIKQYTIKIIFSLFLIYVAFQFLFIGAIELNYQKIKGDFSEKYQKNLCDNDGNQLNAVWNLTTDYSHTYDNTFGTSIGSPSRTLTSKKELVELISLINPVEMVYIAYLNGLNKITVIQNQGRCGEFADAQSFFITDISGLKTRKIYFIGFDHEFPEVYIDKNWYVLDRSFTTVDHPVEAKIYAQYLMKNFPLIFTNVTGMNSSDAKLTVYQEHGFGVV